jgi:hypothetical protein
MGGREHVESKQRAAEGELRASREHEESTQREKRAKQERQESS